MTLNYKFLILYALVLFGAYSVQRAKVDVKKIRERSNTIKKNRKETKDADAKFINKAISLSFVPLTEQKGHPIGSIVVKDGEIIGEGWDKTILLTDPSAHAEIEAIRNACRNLASTSLKGSTIYTSAQPCSMCLSLIHMADIGRVVYCIPANELISMDSSFRNFYEKHPRRKSDSRLPQISMMEDEIPNLIKRYQRVN